MESPHGRVLSIHTENEPPHAVVEVAVSFQCARCAAGKGCGAGLLGGDGKRRRVDALLPGGMDIQEGDDVRIELAPDNVLQASLIVYGLPLMGAVAGAAIAYVAGAGDLGAALAALAGTAVGITAGHMRLRQAACLRRFTPTVAGRLAPQGHAAGESG